MTLFRLPLPLVAFAFRSLRTPTVGEATDDDKCRQLLKDINLLKGQHAERDEQVKAKQAKAAAVSASISLATQTEKELAALVLIYQTSDSLPVKRAAYGPAKRRNRQA
jgi:hypothetical protein